MKDLFKIIFLVILFIRCGETESVLDLDDAWEGEVPYIDAQINCYEEAVIDISKTVNPIGLYDKEAISDARVTLIINDSEVHELSFVDTTQRYQSSYVITPGNCYKLMIDIDDEIISSKEVCIPYFKFDYILSNKTFIDSTLKFDMKIIVPDTIDAYHLVFFMGKSESMLYFTVNKVEFDCLYDDFKVDINCITNNEINFSFEQRFTDTKLYKYSEEDYIGTSIRFESKDLVDLLSRNAYSSSEFGKNNEFDSSFDNAYGVFGYKFQDAYIIPIE